MKHKLYRAFTIVELLIVIVIIAILATITVIAYNGITRSAHESSLKSDLKSNSDLLAINYALNGSYPTDQATANTTLNNGQGLVSSGDNVITYTKTGNNYCIDATYGTSVYHTTNTNTELATGDCASAMLATDGTVIQTITSATCPTANRIRAKDARDNRTYWVQKLADGKCWMLTNLAYAGGGTNTYSDTKTITNSNTLDYTQPYYMIPTGANPTTEPTNPSTATTGTGQYGYLYNWCAAMGSQTGTSACANANTDNWNHNISVCPAGWRLPVGNGAEFTALNTAVNSGSTSSDAGLIASPWLGQRSGGWVSGFYAQGTAGRYWSSTQYSAANAYYLYFVSSGAFPVSNFNKDSGLAVRCVAAV